MKDKVLQRGYVYAIFPSEEQKVLFQKTFGCCRFVYNTILTRYESAYASTGKGIKLSIETELKNEFEFLKEVDSIALQQARMNLQTAHKNFFDSLSGKSKMKASKPTKKKKKHHLSYRTINQNGTIRFNENCDVLKLPKVGWVKIKMHRPLPDNAVIKAATVKYVAGKYYVSLHIEFHREIQPVDAKKLIGLDYAQDGLYVDSEGEKANFPKFYRTAERRLAKLQRRQSRMVKYSQNYKEIGLRIARLQAHIANQRKDLQHKLSKQLADNYDGVCVESINLDAMGQCLHLGKNLHDNGFGAFRNMLAYKLEERGKHFIQVDRWFPSSKMCNHCGTINTSLTLKDREWVCPHCGAVIFRDENAAKNLRDEGYRLLAAS